MERTRASKLPSRFEKDIKTLAPDRRMHKEDLKWLKFCTFGATAEEKNPTHFRIHIHNSISAGRSYIKIINCTIFLS